MNNIINILTQVTIGAFTGYITNTYALNMLFKEYTIFKNIKIGGVIIQTKDEFIEKISKLVEKDIINHKTLGQEIHKKEFSDSIEHLVKDFFTENLTQELHNKSIEDLDSGKETIEETKKFIKKIINHNIEEASEVVFESITTEDLVSREQIAHAMDRLITIVLVKTKEKDFFSEFIKKFMKENGQYTIEELFISSENMTKDTYSLIEEIFETIDKDKLIRNLQYQINKKQVGEIILPNSRENTLKELKANLHHFINSTQGKIMVESFSTEILKGLKKTDKSLLDLLSPTLSNEIQEYLQQNLPAITSKIAFWIKENTTEIEKLIQEGIDETIDDVEGMKRVLLGMIKETVLSEAASKNQVAEKIVEFLENKINLQEVSSLLTTEIIAFLKEKKIKDIIEKLEISGFLNQKTIATQLKDALLFILDSIDDKKTERFFEKTIGELFPLDLVKLINATSLKETLLLNISEVVNDNLTKVFRTPINKIIKNDNIPEYALVMQKMAEEKLPSIDKKNNNIGSLKLVAPINLEIFFNENHKEIRSYLNTLNEIPDFHKKTTDQILNQLHKNLPWILQGKIESLVSQNLQKLTPEEVSTVVHDFMGRELGPIKKFGAFLGGTAGLSLALTGVGTSLTSLTINPLSLLTYGTVGVLTNVVALEMIFRPYKEKKILNRIGLSNFSQGYIIKNKSAFGKNMGKFVEESLLERKMIQERFHELKIALSLELKNQLSKEDFVIIESLLSKYEKELPSTLTTVSLKMLQENKENIGTFLSKKITDQKIGEFDLYQILENNIKNLTSSEENLINLITPELNNNLQKKLEKILRNKISTLQFKDIAIQNIVLDEKNKEKFSRVIGNPPSYWIDMENREKMALAIREKGEEKLLSAEGIENISRIVKAKIEEPISPDKTIGTIFEGRIKNYFEENIPTIATKIEKYLLELLDKKRNEIILRTQKNIYNNLNFLQKGGYSLMGGDELTANAVNHIIFNKIPPYLKKTNEKIEKLLLNILEQNINTIKLKDMQLVLKDKEMNNVVKELLESQETRENIVEIIYYGSLGLLDTMSNIPLKSYLQVADLDKLEDIYEIFSKDIMILSVEGLEEIKTWEKEVAHKSSQHLVLMGNNFLAELRLKDIFAKDEYFIKSINLLVRFLFEELEQEMAGNIISRDILAKDLERSLDLLCTNQKTEYYLQKIVASVLLEVQESRAAFVLPETKMDMLDILIKSGVNSLEKNLPDILSTIDFKTITRSEINKMEGQDIHNLFKSFAGKYFARLKLWGAIGAGFGIHGGISLLATLGYILKRGENHE